jgi:hypothetical protein
MKSFLRLILLMVLILGSFSSFGLNKLPKGNEVQVKDLNRKNVQIANRAKNKPAQKKVTVTPTKEEELQKLGFASEASAAGPAPQVRDEKTLESQLNNTLSDFKEMTPASIATGTPSKVEGSVNSSQIQNLLQKLQSQKKDQTGKVPGFFGNAMDKMQGMVLDSLVKNNPMKTMSKESIVTFFKDKIKGTKAEKVFAKFPKLLEFTADVLKDDEALPKIVEMMGEKKKMLTYSYSFIAIFIISFILNLVMFSKAGIVKRLLFKIFLTLATPAANFLVFYILFREQLAPIVRIVKTYL